MRVCQLGILVLVVQLLALPAAAASSDPADANTALTWPPAPAPARVAFVKTFARAEDLGIGKGFFQRVKEFFIGAAERSLVRPMAVVAASGVIYVADPGAKGVHRFDTVAGNYTLIRGPDQTPLPSPVGIALCAGGDVMFTDSKLAGVYVIRSGTKEALPVTLSERPLQPTGIACDPASGRFFVTDTAMHQVNVYRHDGTLETRIGRRGTAAGEFNFPTLLWRTPEGKLLVTDSLNFRIQIFDERNKLLGKFGRQGDGGGDSPRPKGVATDRFGHIYVVDALFHAVQIFDTAGRFLLGVGGQGQGRGAFWLPSGIFIDNQDADTMYVADSYNRRIQILRYVGGAT